MKARVHGYPRHYPREAHLHIGLVREYHTTIFVSLRCFRPGVQQRSSYIQERSSYPLILRPLYPVRNVIQPLLAHSRAMGMAPGFKGTQVQNKCPNGNSGPLLRAVDTPERPKLVRRCARIDVLIVLPSAPLHSAVAP
jgi:hypothetical protein